MPLTKNRKPLRLLTNYFGFNKQQRNGILVFCCISLFLLLVRISYPAFIKPDPILIQNLPLIERELDSTSISRDQDPGEKKIQTASKLFSFDPNTVTASELSALGFSEKTTKVFLKFRAKGFVFHQKSDLKKVYGVSDKLYESLEPFIVFTSKPTTPSPEQKNKIEDHSNKNLPNKIELNSADSNALLSVNGIGPAFAKRILKYRELLGGYTNVEQLKEVYGFKEDLYLKVKDKFSVNATSIKKLNLNEDDFKVINKHPYISYENCKAIFDRRKSGHLTAAGLKDLLNDDALCNKLLPYLSFD